MMQVYRNTDGRRVSTVRSKIDRSRDATPDGTRPPEAYPVRLTA